MRTFGELKLKTVNTEPTKKSVLRPWQHKVHEVIYEADTPAGKLFDIILLAAILLSVLMVMLESVESIEKKYSQVFIVSEWIFTIFFTIEYVLRIVSVGKPFKYIFSFYGVIDLISIIPTYLGIFVAADTSAFRAIRSIRLLRVFRIFKLGRYLGEARTLSTALKASRPKIIVFLFAVLAIVIVMGTVMYLVEANQNTGFDSIPRSIYWAIVTLTTVGYGDISPQTELGQFIASIIMIMGYAIIAVPTGIVSSEINKAESVSTNTQACESCGAEGHADDAVHCKFCGGKL